MKERQAELRGTVEGVDATEVRARDTRGVASSLRGDRRALWSRENPSPEARTASRANARLVRPCLRHWRGLGARLFSVAARDLLLSQHDGDARLAQRERFAKVAAEWKALSEDQKEVRATTLRAPTLSSTCDT